MAVGHEPLDRDRGWRLGDPLVPATWIEYRGGDGSVCAPAADLAAYGRVFLNDGAGVLSSAGLARMTAPVAEDPDDGWWYGYGLSLRQVSGRRWVGHSGGMIGHHAQLWCDLDAGLAAAAVVNGKAGPALLAEHALRAAAGEDPGEPDLGSLDEPAARASLDPGPPKRWRPMCGTYRSHNPWETAIVVGTCGGSPTAIHWGDAWPLEPLPDGSFRLGEQGWSPERLRFDTPLEGRFMRAVHGATAFHRPI